MRPCHLSQFLMSLWAFLCLVYGPIEGSEILRPRGVPLSRVILYNPESNFTCFDNSKSIPFNQVNDDYCDCPDSSDEPGTAACPDGLFYCANKGHKPSNIPSSRVNDGICDCCDGTDEYSELVNCNNNCLEMGKQAREGALKKAELFKAGKQLRLDLVQLGQKLKNERTEKLQKLQENKNEAEKIKNEKENLKNAAENTENKALEYYRGLENEYKKKKADREAEKSKEEAIKQFKKMDTNQNGYVEVEEIRVRASFDRDRNGEVSIEEAKLFLNNENLVDLETFLEKSWPLMKPFMQVDSSQYNVEVAEEQEQDGEADDLKHDGPEDEGYEADNDEHEYEEPEDHQEEKGEDEEEKITYDEETQKLVDLANEAREQYKEAEKQFRNIETEISDLESNLKTDFGTEEEFAPLFGKCYDFEDREYTYRFCPFDKAIQIPKSGGSDTRLGKWSNWAGPESNRYDSMMYNDGQACWNGPTRSTKVLIGCGIENKLMSVSEPHRCEYMFEFVTPAGCNRLDEESKQESHDEL